ncbi:hypothetical protein [Paraburkholderia atlantica]|uniref:hypothetical protein n=1 Tax=Paraburkholderia atlantica TaxID=2654982 RepID=UPI00161895AD|nr:hypothetical protein [Paraburkholderia atlantica]MBB5420798.1 hypothetical protein [Paraburkholderia atlantica]
MNVQSEAELVERAARMYREHSAPHTDESLIGALLEALTDTSSTLSERGRYTLIHVAAALAARQPERDR